MNFSKKKKKAFQEKVILYVSFVQSPLLIEIRALPQSSQLSKLPKIINHVRRLKFRGGAGAAIDCSEALFGAWALLRTTQKQAIYSF